MGRVMRMDQLKAVNKAITSSNTMNYVCIYSVDTGEITYDRVFDPVWTTNTSFRGYRYCVYPATPVTMLLVLLELLRE